MVRQISVFIDNAPGRLADFTRLLGENHIDMISLCIADTSSFGILRGIVRAPQAVARLIEQAGYTVRVSDVLAVQAPDKPGGLSDILQLLARGGVGIEYLYSFMRNAGGQALIIVRADNTALALRVLTENGVKTLTQEEIEAL